MWVDHLHDSDIISINIRKYTLTSTVIYENPSAARLQSPFAIVRLQSRPAAPYSVIDNRPCPV